MRRLFSALMTLALLGVTAAIMPPTTASEHTRTPNFSYVLLDNGSTIETIGVSGEHVTEDNCVQKHRNYKALYSSTKGYGSDTGGICIIQGHFKANQSAVFKLTPKGNNLYSVRLENPTSHSLEFLKKYYPDFNPSAEWMRVELPVKSTVTFGLTTDNGAPGTGYNREKEVDKDRVTYLMKATMPDGVVQGTVELNSEAASYFPGATTSSPTSTTAKADTVQDLVNAGIIVIIAIILAATTLVFILLKRKTASATASTTSTDSPASR